MSDARTKSDAYWDRFVSTVTAMEAPLYLRFAEGVRGDPALRALAAKALPGQPEANMLFGAVHYLLLRGARHPLREFYPDLADKVAGGDPFPFLRDFCLVYKQEITRLITTRVTNTNEVGRATFLHAGLTALAKNAPQLLHTIEIGPSAGFNMYWDRYLYRYRKNGKIFTAGAPDGEVVIDVPLKGEHMPPLGPAPRVGQRIGLELSPVDLANSDDCDWLRALVWPDHMHRLRRFEAALKANRNWPHDIRVGDALELLPDAMAGIPENETLCICHTLAVYQFSDEAKQALDDILTIAGLRRPVWRLGLENEDGKYPLRLTRYANGAREARVLALCEPQGGWLEWHGLAAI
jgi:hypothetical protein